MPLVGGENSGMLSRLGDRTERGREGRKEGKEGRKEGRGEVGKRGGRKDAAGCTSHLVVKGRMQLVALATW